MAGAAHYEEEHPLTAIWERTIRDMIVTAGYNYQRVISNKTVPSASGRH